MEKSQNWWSGLVVNQGREIGRIEMPKTISLGERQFRLTVCWLWNLRDEVAGSDSHRLGPTRPDRKLEPPPLNPPGIQTNENLSYLSVCRIVKPLKKSSFEMAVSKTSIVSGSSWAFLWHYGRAS
jgi:hypothetical protein